MRFQDRRSKSRGCLGQISATDDADRRSILSDPCYEIRVDFVRRSRSAGTTGLSFRVPARLDLLGCQPMCLRSSAHTASRSHCLGVVGESECFLECIVAARIAVTLYQPAPKKLALLSVDYAVGQASSLAAEKSSSTSIPVSNADISWVSVLFPYFPPQRNPRSRVERHSGNTTGPSSTASRIPAPTSTPRPAVWGAIRSSKSSIRPSPVRLGGVVRYGCQN